MPIRFRQINQPDIEIETDLDTGFTGFLTLPPAVIAGLALSFRYRKSVRLADGSRIAVSVYTALIVWHGAEWGVEVLATGLHPLLGTALLDGSDLAIRFVDGGLVSITPF